MGKSFEGDEETGEVAGFSVDPEIGDAPVAGEDNAYEDAFIPDYRSLAISLAEEMETLKEAHGAVCVRENNLLTKIEAATRAAHGNGGLAEKFDAIRVALFG